jgi:cytochrome c oxidase cbb3-type subunit 2
MPAYSFLFEDREVVGQASQYALKSTGGLTPAPGREIVPTERALDLVAYLLSLNTTYDYPEARPVPASGAGEKPIPASGGEIKPVPASGAADKSVPASGGGGAK